MHSWDPRGHWKPYVPGDRAPWNLRRTVHLHRRAAFAATWSELQRDLKEGPDKSITRLLRGQARSAGVPQDFEEFAAGLARRACEGTSLTRAAPDRDPRPLKAWWVYRMFRGPDPLGERLTLMWHNHFATSNDKVRNLAAMWRQNETFRKYARAPFGELLGAVIRDPALLVWLDARANRKGKPNENLGRELMELFTLGIGHYSEKDVKEAARALTGWTVAEGRFKEDAALHDVGAKTILGRTGRWKGDDLVRMLLEHPATSRRLAWRLCDWLMGEKTVNAAGLDALAAGLRAHHLDIGWAVETVLRSQAFFADANLGSRVLGPVTFAVSILRALECFAPPPNSLVLAEWTAQLGQDLFYPPNVGGWAGGRDWLNAQAIIGRANFAAALVEGRLFSRATPLDALGLARRHRVVRDWDDVITFYGELLMGVAPDTPWRKRLLSGLGPKTPLTAESVRTLVALVVASPKVQLA
jgi:uncharacterized protein (DUF1800 family)